MRPLVIIGLLLTGCPTTVTGAFKTCVNAAGITASSTVEQQVGQALTAGVAGATGGIVGALEGVVVSLLPTLGKDAYVAVDCAVKAWQLKNPLPKNASPAPLLITQYRSIDEWRALHTHKVQ